MGNEQKIIDKIIEDAGLKAEEIINAAKQEAEAVIQKKQQELQLEEKAFNSIADSEAEKAFSKEISGAERRAKQIVLSAKQEMIQTAIERAKIKLQNLTDKEYSDAVRQMLMKADITNNCEILVNKKDLPILRDAISSVGHNISDKYANIEKGFIIKRGDIEYNYSFSSILTIEREEIEKTVAEILFM